MTENRRIILNTLATFGRTLVSACLGLFSARWVLEALGQQDFGLYGVVGGLIFFVTFINATLTGCVSRFYAYSIGAGRNMDEISAYDDLNRWFNTALSIHVLLPIVLLSIGYPICFYAIKHWLVIPAERLSACLWVFHISLVIAFFAMISAPYIAMYTAYQLITELSIFGLINTFVIFIGTYALLFVKGDRLIWYACMMMAASVSIQIVQMIRARFHFKACQISLCKMYDFIRIRKLFSYASWQLLGGLGFVLRNQGVACLVNVMLGPKLNASYTIGNQVAMHSATFSYALNNAIAPAMTTNEGAGNREQMVSLALRSCKFGGLMVLFFGLPMVVEIDNLLELWLKNPPPQAAPLCIAMVVVSLMRQLTMGYMMSIHAHGKIGSWQVCDAVCLMLVAPVAYVFVKLMGSLLAVGYAFVFAEIFACANKIYYSHRLTGMPSGMLLLKIVPRFAFVSTVVIGVLLPIRSYFEPTFFRLCITTAISCLLIAALAFVFILTKDERMFLLSKVAQKFNFWSRDTNQCA